MPQYKVKPGQKGFYNGRLYDSNGKRPVLVTGEPIEGKIPSWLIPVQKEAESVAAQRQAAADLAAANAKDAINAAKAAQKAAKAAKEEADSFVKGGTVPPAPPAPPVLDDKVEEAVVTFTEAPKPSVVETL